MAALTSLALGLGAASMAFGAYQSYEGSQQQKKGYEQMQQGSMIQAQAAAQQAQISKEQAAASVTFAGREKDINILAADQSVAAAGASRDLQQSTIAQERAVQEQNRLAMELGARRQSMEIIRAQQRARALALATNVAQGGSGATRGSSALAGAYGQIGGQTGVNLLGVNQNLAIGRNIFAANDVISNNRVAQADLEFTYAQQQAANQTAKSNLSYDYAVSNAAFQTRFADTQTLMSQGQGVVNMGQGMVGMGQAQSQFGSSFMQGGASILSLGSNPLFGGSPTTAGPTPFYNPSPFMKMFNF